jgi:hypothetical protein
VISVKTLLALSLAFLVCCPPLSAQFETSEVLGNVLDPSGAPVPHVRIVLKSDKTLGDQSKAAIRGHLKTGQ